MNMTHTAIEAPLLRLRIESYLNQPPAQPQDVTFSAEGGMVGRAPGNQLVLDDPSKYISRAHASVTWRDGQYYLTDAGSNPSIVNNRPLGAGARVALGDGDRVVIGDYVLLVALEATAVALADATMMMAAPAPAPPPPLPLFVPPPAPVATPLPPFEAWSTPPARAALPDDAAQRDMLAGMRILDSGAWSEGNDAFADPLGLSLVGGAAPVVARAAEQDHVSPELQAFAPPSSAFVGIPADYDPLADLLAPMVAPAAVALPPALPPAASSLPAAPPSLPPAAATPLPPAATDSAVLQALLDGLGLPELRSSHAPEQLARLAGEMLRAATTGTMDVLMARALTKRESHIDMTMIAPRANNPLKFFPDPDSALTQMLSAQMPGYLPPLPAISGAFDDLKAHELAVIAGMHAALAAVVQRFDPARIEQRLSEPGRLDKLMPASRKARMWDRLVELYGELARDADEDLQRLFGEKFSGAYEQQVDRLRGERR